MIGILLVLHGSKVSEWVNTAIGYKELLKNYYELVEYGFLEINKPDIREALEKLIKDGATKVVVVPLLFAAGTHFKKDIPEKLRIKDGKVNFNGKDIEVVIADPLGVDKRIAEVLVDRIKSVI
ncbi:MAG: CbiX/SirB N-terminal domain-containing protein [Sulfolobaceae archaeon]